MAAVMAVEEATLAEAEGIGTRVEQAVTNELARKVA